MSDAPQQRRIIFQHIDEPGYTPGTDCYLCNGGYEILRRATTIPHRHPQTS